MLSLLRPISLILARLHLRSDSLCRDIGQAHFWRRHFLHFEITISLCSQGSLVQLGSVLSWGSFFCTRFTTLVSHILFTLYSLLSLYGLWCYNTATQLHCNNCTAHCTGRCTTTNTWMSSFNQQPSTFQLGSVTIPLKVAAVHCRAADSLLARVLLCL